MEQRAPEDLIPAIKDVVHELVVGNYAGLVADGRAAGWAPETLDQIAKEIARFEGPLVDLPDEAFQDEIALPLDDAGWGLDVQMWTTTGRSSYTLVLDLHESPHGLTTHIEDLRIM